MSLNEIGVRWVEDELQNKEDRLEFQNLGNL